MVEQFHHQPKTAPDSLRGPDVRPKGRGRSCRACDSSGAKRAGAWQHRDRASPALRTISFARPLQLASSALQRRFTESQIVAILKESDAGRRSVTVLPIGPSLESSQAMPLYRVASLGEPRFPRVASPDRATVSQETCSFLRISQRCERAAQRVLRRHKTLLSVKYRGAVSASIVVVLGP